MTDGTKVTSSGKTAEDFTTLADSLRSRVDLIGKSLAAIATLGTGAVGLTKVGDLAPIQRNEWDLVILVGVSLATAAIAGIVLAVRLMKVNEPVVLDADLRVAGLSGAAQEDVEKIYRSSARRFGFSSLLGLEERENGLRKAAARASSEDERARRTALADEVQDEMELAISRARLAVIRRNAASAVSGKGAVLCYVLAVVGLLVFAISADVVTSDRTEAVSMAKACAEARTAGATEDDLKASTCKPTASKKDDVSTPPTADEARVELASTLTEALKSCTSLADEDATTNERPLSRADCDKIAAAVNGLLEAQ